MDYLKDPRAVLEEGRHARRRPLVDARESRRRGGGEVGQGLKRRRSHSGC